MIGSDGAYVGFLVLKLESLCLSTQSVISLSLKTLLKHVGLKLFLLNFVRFLSVKSFER